MTLNFLASASLSNVPSDDPLDAFIAQKISPQTLVQRNAQSLHEAEAQANPLAFLLTRRWWRLLAQYCAQRLARVSLVLENIDEICSLWHHRLSALIGIKAYVEAESDLSQLGSLTRSELLWEAYPLAGRSGPMMLGLFLFGPRLQLLKGDALMAINGFYELLSILDDLPHLPISITADLRTQALQGILEAAYELKDFHMICDVANMILYHQPHELSHVGDIARLHLRFGDINRCEQMVKQIEVELIKRNINADQAEILLVHRALLYMAKGKYDDALLIWQNLGKLYLDDHSIIGNTAVCHVFVGNIQKAVEMLQRAMAKITMPADLCEPVLLNLATLFDLTIGASTAKKTQLLIDVARVAGDGLNVSVFKL